MKTVKAGYLLNEIDKLLTDLYYHANKNQDVIEGILKVKQIIIEAPDANPPAIKEGSHIQIPDTIKIAGFNYDIVKKPSAFVGKAGTALDGQHHYATKTITVSGEGCKEYQALVFLHEVCHAIIEAYVAPDRHDEHFVEQFSKGLYQAIVDNPDIFIHPTEKGGEE